MNISTDDLKKLLEYSKALKCDIIMVKYGIIYGTDNNFVHLKIISDIQYNWSDMLFYSRDLSEFMKRINDISDTEITYFDISTFIRMQYQYTDVFNDLIHSAIRYIDNTISFSNEDLRKNDNFNEIMTMKAGDGIGLLKLSERYILTLYNGLLPINKSDKVKVYIRDIDDYRYLANFTIIKKKFSIDVYFMYLFLN